jgi:pimeloyl-ACP methyl ester carboxylesterase
MDLRGHGNSRRGLTGEHTFENCAKDVLETMEGKASIIMGHSFGGRVALECAVQQESQSTWILDSVPGQTHESVERVLRVLQEMGELKHQYDNRSQIRESLQEQHGLEASIAQWLTSGVSKDEDGDLMWGFDMDVINALMPQFATQDYFGMLEFLVLSEETPAHNVHLVRGGKNEGWSVEILSQLDKIARRSDRFHLHVSPHAGHWIHVDDLPLLVKLFEMYHSAV